MTKRTSLSRLRPLLALPLFFACNAQVLSFEPSGTGSAADLTYHGTIVTYASGITPGAIAVDATNVYWTEDPVSDWSNGALKKAAIDGGPPTTLASGQWIPDAIAVDATNVYWTDLGSSTEHGDTDSGAPTYSGSVMSVPIGGGTPTTLASGQDAPCSVALSGSNLLWGNASNPGSGPLNVVTSVPLDGGSLTTIISEPVMCPGITVNDTNVYWGNGNQILRTPLGGGADVAIVTSSGGDGIGGPFIQGANAYWESWTNGSTLAMVPYSIMTVPLSGGTPTTLVSGLPCVNGVATDATNIYWTTTGCAGVNDVSTAGTLAKMPLAGGTVTTLVSGLNHPGSVVVDGTSVYWTNTGSDKNDGSIMRLTPK